MAGLDHSARRWTYTAKGGVTYRLRATAAIVSQVDGSSNVKVGGSAAAVTVPLPPRGFKPRRVYVHNDANNVTRAVVAYEDDAPICTAGETINLQYGDTSIAFTSLGAGPSEKLPAGIADNS